MSNKMVLVGGSKATAEFGRDRAEILTAAKSLKSCDTGKIFYLNSATEFAVTLPSAADAGLGWNCEVIVKAAPASASYTVTEKAADDTNVIIVNGINELEVDDIEDGPYSAGCTTITFADGLAVAGDWIKIRCDGTKFYVTGQSNADGGITVA